MKKEFPFEDFTLVMSRNCNLSCEYCPLEHFNGNMDTIIIEKILSNIIKYKSYKLWITLFWWEPLINKEWIKYILEYFKINKEKIKWNELLFELKIITNWTLLDEEYISIFRELHDLNFINLTIGLSLDWKKDTQLRQRNFKNQFHDYYSKFLDDISKISSAWINMNICLVMSFFNKNIVEDILFLINNLNLPIFIMPVDLTHEYISTENDFNVLLRRYLLEINKVISFIKKYKLDWRISNLKSKDYYDLKIPPIWPSIDYNWDVYCTRDYLFQLDKESSFNKIWNILYDDFNSIIDYFYQNSKEDLELFSLNTYYWRSLKTNKSIGDYFTRLIYEN